MAGADMIRPSRAWRFGAFSRRPPGPALGRLAVLIGLLLVVAVLSLCAGQHWLSPAEVLRALTGQGRESDALVINLLRLPRVVLALLAGGALGVAGLLLQTLVRNPLASPDLLGVGPGAAAAAVLFLAYGAGVVSPGWLPVAAIAGALACGVAVYALAWKGGVTPLRLVLTGVAVASLASAVTTFVLVRGPANATLSAYVWLTGSVFGATWTDIARLAAWLAPLGIAMALLARHAAIAGLGDELAQGLGQRVEAMRALLLTLAVAMAGAAVSCTGPLAFTGLIAPHLARRLIGHSFGVAAWASAAIGGLLVMVADLSGRVLFAPRDLPAGIFVAALGAAFFVQLMIRARHRAD